MDERLQQQLDKGIKLLGLNLTIAQTQSLEAYLVLFHKWNKTFNLSAIRTLDQMVALHVLDSLSVAPWIEGKTWLDVGTGGGLPGIPLAITFPDKHFTLLDSTGKKTRFLHQVVQNLGLTNVTVVNGRAEAIHPQEPVDGIISRAFASLNDMITCTHHWLGPNGHFWAMKGQMPETELSQIQKGFIVSKVQPLSVPGVKAERCLVVLKPDQQET